MPTYFFIVQFDINNFIFVCLELFKPNYLLTTNGNKLMYAPRPHKALTKLDDPIILEIMKALGPSLFFTRERDAIVLQWCKSLIDS